MQLSLAIDRTPILPRIRAPLLARHGPQRDARRLDPVSQLILAIVSARTLDAVSLSAFERLSRRYRSWDDLRHTAPADIEAIIRPVTYAEVKARQLPRALGLVAARCGGLDLAPLADWPEEKAMGWLEDLPGIGTRNAAVVLNFSKLRKRVLPVGTHHLRVGQRLGLLPSGTDYTRGHAIFMRLVPDAWDADDLYEFHWLVKLHAQKACTYWSPTCYSCPLRGMCAFARLRQPPPTARRASPARRLRKKNDAAAIIRSAPCGRCAAQVSA